MPSYRYIEREREPLSIRDNEDETLNIEFKKQTPKLKFSRNKSQGHFREVFKQSFIGVMLFRKKMNID